ncbi:MAG: hypothetical protein ABIJ18_02820 [archaeon]
MEKNQIKLFENKNCQLVIDNGFVYNGFAEKVTENSVIFHDKINGKMIFDLKYIRSIGERGELRKNGEQK